MRILTLLLSLITTTLFNSCGMVISGTGQHGEAKMIGMVSMSSGEPAARMPITISSSNHIPERGEFRAASKSWDVYTDKDGYFEFIIFDDDTVTVSARFGNDLLYIPNLTAENVEPVQQCQFEEGVPYSVYPWWSDDGEADIFAVKGTDWTFAVEDTEEGELLLPGEMITLIHKNEQENYEVNAVLDNPLGNPVDYLPLADIPDTVKMNTTFIITVNRDITDGREGIKFWPDLYNNSIEPIYFSTTNSFEYRFADSVHKSETVYCKVLINRLSSTGELIAEEFTKVVVLIP